MTRKAGEIVTLLFVGLALGFWVIAMTTHGWLVLAYKIQDSPFTMFSPAYSRHEVIYEFGVFYLKQCEGDLCWHMSLPVQSRWNRVLEMPTHTEMQIESVIAALLCVVCCVLLMISLQSTSKRFLHVVMLLPCAVLFQSVLIGRTSKAGGNVPLLKKEIEKNFFSKFPYSILLAGVGMLFAIIGWVLSIVMYCELRKQRLQSLQDQNLNEVAETFPDVPQDQYMAGTAYTSITRSLDQDIREASKISTNVSQDHGV